jgi:protein TonB
MIARQNPRRWLGALRWGAAALAVVSAHGGVAWYAVHWKPAHAEAAAGAPEPAIMIELSPVSVAQEAPAETLPPAPEPVEAEPPPPEPVKQPPPPEPEPEPPPEPIVEPPPVEPPPPEPTRVQVPEPEIKLPDLPKIPDALAVLAPPPPPKKVDRPVERKPPPPKKVVERKRVERPRQREAAAPPPSPAPAAAPTRANQGVTAAVPSVSTASWRGSLIAHLNRYKRFPGGARPGTVQVAFSIDRGGRVLSARLVGSSGDSALDDEAVSMIRRASPVPAPPAGVGGGGAVSLAVPVRFSR